MRRYQPPMGKMLFLEYEAVMAREMLFAACQLTRMEELATIALAEFDAETHFHARAARGSVAEGLRMLNTLDAADEASRS